MSKKCVGGTTTGMMYVGMLLLYSHVKLSACNDGEPVSCRPYHRMQKKKKKKETDMKDPDAWKTKVKGYCNLLPS